MKALVKVAHGVEELELRDWPEPVPGEGEVRLRVAYAGICGTDLHIVKDEFPSWPPVVLGHEFIGVVDQVGAGVDLSLLGAAVVCEPHARACGVCYLCRRGHVELCAEKRSPGWGMDGAFAAFVRVPVWLVHRVPSGLSLEVAVLAEPMAIVMTALLRAGVNGGDHALVVGPGPVGLLAALALRQLGTADVLVAGGPQDASRLALASSMGLSTASGDDVASTVRDGTDGRGVDLAVECSGSAGGVATVFECIRRRGRVASIGLSGRQKIEVPWDLATSRAVDVAFSMSSNYEAWDPGLTMLGRIAADARRLPTVFPLEAWREAFQAVADRSVMKAVLRPIEA